MPSTSRSKKLPATKHPHNQLLNEKSPYLLQHAHNPVNWYPWGQQAFEKARSEDKPIFLSIGYSTCHWCHVMERESFEDDEVAKLMNETFVSIKVDREERPDIDNIYMTACQVMTGRGGWPLTIIMTPDKKPFFAGTYFPKKSRFGQIGMLDLIPRIKEVWEKQHEEVYNSAEKVVSAIKLAPSKSSNADLGMSTLQLAYNQLKERFDEVNGGFGIEPKFPTPHNLSFLLRYWKRTDDLTALKMVEKTLQAMRKGGIYDHLGFGFHRYSTDKSWFLPHFEKMLYDQALLAIAYLEAYQATKNSEYANTAREIFTYVLRDMTAPAGGFYSAEDADSEGKEGKFYLWSKGEICQILKPRESDIAIKVFNIQEDGNFKDRANEQYRGANILHLKGSLTEVAAQLNMSKLALQKQLEVIRKKLFDYRSKRVHPGKDDKILTDWNGLMIAALAKGTQVLNEPEYAKAAGQAADFILKNLRQSNSRLLHRYRDGEALLPAYLDDYAFLVWGLIELYEATFKAGYLQQALKLTNEMLDLFWDDKSGGFYLTANDNEDLFFRSKEIYDGATPSGNSVAALNLLRLGRLTAKTEFEEKASAISRYFSKNIRELPITHTQMMLAVDFSLGPTYEVVIVGSQQADETKLMLKALREEFIPNKVVLFRDSSQSSPEIIKIADFVKRQSSIDGKATAYICLNYACKSPTTDVGKMLEMLTAKK